MSHFGTALGIRRLAASTGKRSAKSPQWAGLLSLLIQRLRRLLRATFDQATACSDCWSARDISLGCAFSLEES